MTGQGITTAALGMEGLMAKQISHAQSQRVDRRCFLVSATATVASTGLAAPVVQVESAGPEGSA
jgi:hypothetical protein